MRDIRLRPGRSAGARRPGVLQRGRMRTTSRVQAGVGVLLAAVLTGCAQIPVESPVVAGPAADSDGISSVRIEARDPQPGATPAQIVQGFLDAMSTYDISRSQAKKFLSEVAQDDWDVDLTVIYDSPAIETADDGSVHLDAQRVADIDAEGQYTAASPGAPLEIVLPMVRERGEWRIAVPPPGVLITTFDRDNDYSPYTTYYPSSAADILVPDVVWLPGGAADVATLLAQALVDGQTTRLGDSVWNAFPDGTAVDAVTVGAGGVATVNLRGPVVTDDPATLQTMAAQLAYTLGEIPTLRGGVVITADGEPLAIPGANGVITPRVFPDRDSLLGFRNPNAYALMSDRLVSLDPDGTILSTDGSLGVSAGGALSVAVSLDESLAAVVSADGRSVTTHTIDRSAVSSPQTFTGINVARPSWDRFGNLWVVDRTQRGSVVYVIAPDGSGRDTPISAPAFAAGEVLSFRVSPDGSRVAASMSIEGETRLLFLRVLRDERVTLSGVAEPPALPELAAVGDLAWVGETDVAVVISASDRIGQPATIPVDASVVVPEVETGVVSIAGYPQQTLFAVSDDGTIRRKVSAITWETVGEGTAVTYPG